MLLSDVRVFVEIASLGSFTAAGRALGLPKSTIARQLARLEEALGCQLALRTTRSVSLTDKGRTFLPHARRLVDDGIEAANAMHDPKIGASGNVVLSAPSTFGRTFIAPLLPEFRRRNPNVRVALHLSAQRVELGAGLADAAVRLGPLFEPNLAIRKLGFMPYVFVCAPSCLGKSPAPRTPLELSQFDFVELRPPSNDGALTISNGRETEIIRFVASIEIEDAGAVRFAVLAGGGVAALPLFLVQDDIRTGELIHLLPEWAPVPSQVSLVHSIRTAQPPRVRALVDFLADKLGNHAPWTQPRG